MSDDPYLIALASIAAQIPAELLRDLREAHDSYAPGHCAAESEGQLCCIDYLTTVTDPGPA